MIIFELWFWFLVVGLKLLCAPIINEMSSKWDRVVPICDQCVDESDEIEYYIKKSHVNPHDKKGEHEHIFHLFMNLLYYASQGVAEDLCLSTPSLGITGALHSIPVRERRTVLSTPSLGITGHQGLRGEIIADVSYFQLPLSGSRSFAVFGLGIFCRFSFNSLSRDHSMTSFSAFSICSRDFQLALSGSRT